VREPAVGVTDDRQRKGNMIRSSVPTAASFSFSFCYWPAIIICVIRPIFTKRIEKEGMNGLEKECRSGRNQPFFHKDFRPAAFSFLLSIHEEVLTA
jgi:hypothetical protein